MPNQRAQVKVSARMPDGKYGTFIADGAGPISPVFPCIDELIPWMKNNGWYWDEHGTTPNGDAGTYYPWRVAKV